MTRLPPPQSRQNTDDAPVPLRRLMLMGLLPLALGACSTTRPDFGLADLQEESWPLLSYYTDLYGEIVEDDITIPAIDVTAIDRQFLRQMVDYPTDERTGTIVVDPYRRFLYLVMEDGKAMRYGVGVAKAGLEFEGGAVIARKARWPNWAPTRAMIEREPDRYVKYARGVLGGLDNPLGARALYLYRDGRDTLYRIHGTIEPWSIGKAVSSGCIRLFNHDIIDLYNRVPAGSRAVVLGPDENRPYTGMLEAV